MMNKDEVRKYTDRIGFLATQLDSQDYEIKNLNKKLEYRLLVLSSPTMGTNKLKLTDIIDLALLQELQDKFADAFHLASLIYDEHGEPITKPHSFSEFCTLLRSTTLGMKRCARSKAAHHKLAAEAKGPVLFSCGNFHELLDCTIPLYINNRHVASWACGQRIERPVDEDRVRTYASEIGLDPNELFNASKLLHVGTAEDFRLAMDALNAVCKALGLLGLQNIQQARTIKKLKAVELKYNKLYLKIKDNSNFERTI